MNKLTSYPNSHNIKCFKCNKLLSIMPPGEYELEDYETEIFDNGYILDDDTILEMSICTDNFFCVCMDCECHSLCCPNCKEENKNIQFCRFLGHNGYFVGSKTKDIRKFRTTEKIFNNIMKNENINLSEIKLY